MIEYAWVIQRDDGSYFKGVFNNNKLFFSSIKNAFFYSNENLAKEEIYFCDLHNCKVIKVEIKVVLK